MDPQGKDILMRLGQKGVAGTGHNNFNLPTDVAFAPNSDIYVSDGYGGARVVKFSHDGKFLLEFGTRGKGPGQFGLPATSWSTPKAKSMSQIETTQEWRSSTPTGDF
jgi:hypothetical protein